MIAKIILFFSSIYIPLFILSTYSTLNLNKLIQKKRILNEDVSQKILSIKEGFIPSYHPNITKKRAHRYGIYPIGTLPNTKTYYCNEGYGLITYHSDRFGLRNLDTKWGDIQNKSNIFIIGDSFAKGACVPNKATIDNVIQNSVKTNVLNLAFGANGPYEYQAILKSMVAPIVRESEEENIVIIIFFLNDNINLDYKSEELFQHTNSIISINDDGEVIPKDFYIRQINKLIKENYPFKKSSLIRSQKYKFISMLRQDIYRILSLVPIRSKIEYLISLNLRQYNETISPSQKSIELLSKTCFNKCKPYTVYIPNKSSFKLIENKYKSYLKKNSLNYGIPFIDLSNIILNNKETFYAPKGPHLSIKGYRKVADLIVNQINKFE